MKPQKFPVRTIKDFFKHPSSTYIRKFFQKWLLKKKILFLLILLIAFLSFMPEAEPQGHLSSVTKRIVSLGPAEVHIKEGGDLSLQLKKNDTNLLTISMGYFLPDSLPEIFTIYGSEISFLWKEGLQVDLTYESLKSVRRFNVTWKVTNLEYTILKDEISMKHYHWYGGTFTEELFWPIEKWNTNLLPYITGDSTVGQFGNVQERYWLSSAGLAVVVHQNDPLFVKFNGKEKTMTFVSCWKAPYRNDGSDPLQLSYSIYQAADIMAVHKSTSSIIFSRPKTMPDTLVFRHPIWTTWIVYKWNINQEKVIQYAKDIHRHGFNASQIEIDDDWTPHYGDFIFDSLKFPDPGAMVKAIHQFNFRVTLWVPPFCTLQSNACAVPDIWVEASVTNIVSWWNGYGRLLDVTSPRAERWLRTYLNKLRHQYNISSFKFDSGEASYLPNSYKTYRKLESPNDYTRYYAELASKIDGNINALEIRVGCGTQHLPLFTRFMDKATTWGYDNGLKTLIPHAIQLGLLGYFFFIPDIIGGNQYSFQQLDKELYIRWLQASVFMPVLQFSRPPWHFDQEAIEITRDMTKLHYEYSDFIIELAQHAIETGDPIIRPLWWISPQDEIALRIDSEFLVGEEILVAPVLEPKARSRDVYLPKGRWERHGKVYNGPGWLKEHPAQLKDIIYFHRKAGPEASTRGATRFHVKPGG